MLQRQHPELLDRLSVAIAGYGFDRVLALLQQLV